VATQTRHRPTAIEVSPKPELPTKRTEARNGALMVSPAVVLLLVFFLPLRVLTTRHAPGDGCCGSGDDRGARCHA